MGTNGRQLPDVDTLMELYEGSTLAELGRRFGYTPQRIQQVLSQHPDHKRYQQNNLREEIIRAVVYGATNTRQIARVLRKPLSTVNNYFYKCNNVKLTPFENGRVLQWTPGRANTIRLADDVFPVWENSEYAGVWTVAPGWKNGGCFE